MRSDQLDVPVLYVVHAPAGIKTDNIKGLAKNAAVLRAFFFLVSPEADPSQHLRLLAGLASRIDELDFASSWPELETDEDLKEYLMRKDSYFTVVLDEDGLDDWRGQTWKELRPAQNKCRLLWLIRDGQPMNQPLETPLRIGDRLTILGVPALLETLRTSVK